MCGTVMPLCHWEFCLLTCFLKHGPLSLADLKLHSPTVVASLVFYNPGCQIHHQHLADWDNQLLLAHGVTNQERAMCSMYYVIKYKAGAQMTESLPSK